VFGRSILAPLADKDWFDVIHKKDCFLIEVNGLVTPAKGVMSLAKRTVTEKWGFNPESKPLWVGGTVGPVLFEELVSGKFFPAKGNVLLVGDAAGLVPKGGEGINMALKSGIMASDAIIKAANTSQEAAPIYLTAMQPLIEILEAVGAKMQVSIAEGGKLLDELVPD
jgi:hypothetical protein